MFSMQSTPSARSAPRHHARASTVSPAHIVPPAGPTSSSAAPIACTAPSRCSHASTSSPVALAALFPSSRSLGGGHAAVPRPSVRCRSTDYIAAASDEGVLRMPARAELDPEMIHKVFGYGRNLNERYYQGKVIGAGSFGVVRECVEVATGRRFAVKTIPKVPKRGACTPRYLLKLRTEVEIMQQLGFSLDAVNLKDVYEDNDNIHLVMELCEGGALLERIEEHKYSERYIAGLVRSILRFISQCHAKGIIYRDVKPDNFLFVNNADDSPLKATDFGLSIRHWPDEPKLTSRSGTPAYMAPELVLQNYDEKCDIWSVGMMAYQLLTGRFPFWEDVRSQTLSDVWKSILSEEIDWTAPELAQLSAPAVEFLQRLLQKDPNMRPSAFQALQHTFISAEDGAANLPLKGSVVQRLQRFSTYGNLKQMVLRMIMEEIQDGSKMDKAVGAIGGLQDLFNQLDTDNSGAISFTELSTGLKRQGYVLNDNEVEQLVRKIDADHDGNMTLSEFMATLIDWDYLQRDQGWQLYLDHAFKRLDIDGDGSISLDEILDHLPRFGGAVGLSGDPARTRSDAERMAEAKCMLREADTNGDGKISREEFYNLLKDSHAPDSLSFYDTRLQIVPEPAAGGAAAAAAAAGTAASKGAA